MEQKIKPEPKLRQVGTVEGMNQRVRLSGAGYGEPRKDRIRAKPEQGTGSEDKGR